MIDGPIVLTGGSGILGSAFARRFGDRCFGDRRLVRLDRDALDVSDPAAIRRRVVDLAPTLVINCAADTDVEGAEIDPSRSWAANVTLATALAQGAAEAGAGLLHFSSTGCYGAWKATPYHETDPLRPTTAHHRSKAEGEDQVLRAHKAALIMRLGWVFGGHPGQPKNFVWARIVEARGKAEIGANAVQVGCPTAAEDVVGQAMDLLAAEVTGVVNCVGAGSPARRIDYVGAILEGVGGGTRVVASDFARRAPVSPNEAAVNARLGELGLDRMPAWRESLAGFVHHLLANAA